MKLIRLQAFKGVVTSGTVSEAARQLKCSQPRISRLIAELEEEVGFPLFRREKQRLEITPEGKIFFNETEHILLGLENIDRIAEDISKNRERRLSILAQSHIAHSLLPLVCKEFDRENEGIRYYIEIRPREDLTKWLGGHQFDLAFAPLPAKHPLVRHEELVSVKLTVLLPDNHRLYRQEKVHLEDICNEPLIALTKGMLLRNYLDELFNEMKQIPNIRIETPSALSACQMVAQGLGIALMNPFTATLYHKKGYVVRPLEPEYRIPYGVLYLRQDPPRQLVRAFIETAKAIAGEMVRDFCVS